MLIYNMCIAVAPEPYINALQKNSKKKLSCLYVITVVGFVLMDTLQ
jgi:hypothetical protein